MTEAVPHPLCPWCHRPVELVAPKITPCSAFCDEHGFVYLLPPVCDHENPPPCDTPGHYDANPTKPGD